jgi:predicted transcriptional regulator
MEQQVRLDIIELKLEQLSKVTGKEGKESIRIQDISDTKQILEEVKDMLRTLGEDKVEISKAAKKRKGVKVFEPLEGLSPTEHLIVGLLKEGALTVRQIQEKINKSREHTARLMKKLFESGYVFRNEKKMPYVYEITEKARELVNP